MDPVVALGDLLAGDDAEIELDRAALCLAAAEYPDLDVAAELARLDELADRARPRLAGLAEPRLIVEAVAGFLHDERGFRGNVTDYYDPANSYLNDVLARRLGIPISLAVVYLAVGRRLGLPFEGVGMPGHFLVRYADPRQAILLDPFAGGQVVGDAECEARLRALYGPHVRLEPEMLRPVGNRAILARMLANLKGIYLQREDWPRLVRTIDLTLVVRPGATVEYRDRGLTFLRTGDLRRARADLEHFLENQPGAAEEIVAGVREQLGLIERLEAMRN